MHEHRLQADWTQAESSQHPLLFLSNFLTICPPNVLYPFINCIYLSLYIHVLLYLCGLACTSICSSIHTPSIYPCIHSPYYGNASFIIHLLPLLVHFHPLISHDCVCGRQRGLVTAVIGTGVRDERNILGSIPKTILILAHPAMQVMHSFNYLAEAHTQWQLSSQHCQKEKG